MRATPAGSLLLLSLACAPLAFAAVDAPVLKWAYGGCSGSPGNYACDTGWYSSPAVADLDGDGQSEVIWGGYDLAVVRGSDGVLRASAASGSRIWPGVAIADLTGDGTLEIVVGRNSDTLTVYRPVVNAGTMTLNTLWTRNPFGSGEVRTLAVADLENDGQLEVIVGRGSGGDDRQVNVYGSTGVQRAGWPARHVGEPGYGWGMYNENVAVGDLNGDGLREVFAPTDTHYITALDRNGAQLTVHPRYTGRTYWSQVGVHVSDAVDVVGYANCGTQHRPNFANTAPAMADMDGNGTLELVVIGDVYNCAIGDPDGDLYHLPWIFNYDRTRWAASGYDWVSIPTAEPGSGPLSQDYNVIQNSVQNTVLADLDGDGKREILYPSYDGRLHVFWLDKTEHGSWPVTIPTLSGGQDTFRFASEPIVADLDNDGQAEVLVASWPKNLAGLRGELLIYSSQGVLLRRTTLPAPALYGDVWNGALGAPTLANIDGDPDLELVLGTVSSGIVAYDLPNTASARVLWGTGRGSFRRTGVQAGALSIADTAAGEGNAGSNSMTFTVTLSRASDVQVSVAWSTSSGTATAGSDYTAGSGVLSFPPGTTSRTLSVPVLGDVLDEADETVQVTLASASGAPLVDAVAVGTIVDDDPMPSLSIGDVSLPEGTGGSSTASFAVTLSAASGRDVTVSYASSDWTALAGPDYLAVGGSLSFTPGQTLKTVPVTIATDALDEPWETFGMSLFNSTAASLADGQAQGVIEDDDATPTLTVGDASGSEGQAGTTLQNFTVTLQGLSASTVSANYATADQSATAGSDYLLATGALSWAPGTNGPRTVSVGVLGDKLNEPNESYLLSLSGAQNAALADGQGQGTLVNDDAAGLTIDDVRLVEPKAGTRQAHFTVALTPPDAVQTVTVDWATAPDSATDPDDFTAAGGSLSFAPGVATQDVDVTVGSDTALETVERFFVNLTNPGNATIASGQGSAYVVDPQIGGDFDGDGDPDILWRHVISGRNVVWLMNGAVREQGLFTTPDQRSDTNWRIVGTADLANPATDRRTDIVWRNAATGALDAWLMNGTSEVASVALSPAIEPNLSWGIVGTGDFNADGRPDLFWRNSSNAALRVWLMNDITRVVELPTVPPAGPDMSWVVVGVGDLSGDGQPDILWRHQASGKNVVWTMNGVQRISGFFMTPDTFADLNWKMAGVGDYNLDGWPDILWRHGVSGRNVLWLMRGAVKAGGTYTTPDQLADTNWQIVGPR